MEGLYQHGSGADVRVGGLLRLYRREGMGQLSERSDRLYRIDLRALERYFVREGDNPRVATLGRGDVKGFLSWRRMHKPDGEKRDEPLAGNTVKRALSVLSVVLEEAVEREWLPSNPAHGVSVSARTREPVILSDEQYDALLEAAEPWPMCRMWLLLCGEAGLRSRSEALTLEWPDVDLDEGFLHVVHGRDGRETKGKRSRYVPMTSRLRRELRQHAAEYRMRLYDGRRSPYVVHHTSATGTAKPGTSYTRFNKTMRKVLAADEVDVPDEWRVHDLRHRRITEWLREGHSPAKVRKAAGHAKLSTTLQYEHLVRADLEGMVGEDAAKDELGDMVG